MESVTPPERRSRASLLAGLLGLAALALAVFIGTQVLSVLYGIVAPPLPPVPSDADEVSYTSIGYGVDEWVYSVPQHPCDMVAYYEAQGGQCRLAPYKCTMLSTPGDVPTTDEMVARCGGSIRFSIFVMDWRVFLSEEGEATTLEVAREVNWISGEPRPFPETTDTPG